MITRPSAAQLTASSVQPVPRKHTTIPLVIAYSIAAVIGMTLLTANAQLLRAASAAQNREVNVFAAADDASPLVESVRDGSALVPIGEMTGAGGMKWFMVKTKSGNVGWIMAGDNAEVRRIDDHFRALPKDSIMVGPSTAGVSGATSAPETATKTSAAGAITIPIKIERSKVLALVKLTSGLSNATANLVVDTGASQTMISKRLARELRLPAVDTQTGKGLGVAFVSDVGQVESVKVGDAEVKNLRVGIHDGGNEFGGEGLLGFDFLGRFLMSVDTDKKVMVLTPRN